MRGSCGNCGQPGAKRQTCGKTPEHPGTYGGARQPQTKKPAKAKSDDDDSEGAPPPPPAPRPAPAVAHPFRTPPPPRSPVPQRAPLIVSPPTVLQLSARREFAENKPKKVVDRNKALKEIRAEQLRKLAAKREKPVIDEGNDKWAALKDDEDDDERPLSEREVLSDFKASTID